MKMGAGRVRPWPLRALPQAMNPVANGAKTTFHRCCPARNSAPKKPAFSFGHPCIGFLFWGNVPDCARADSSNTHVPP